MEGKTCCFTGHRPTKFSFKYDETSPACKDIKNQLKAEILNMINNRQVSHFITGMALGVDTWAAEIILNLKKLYPGITITAAVPCPEQSHRWGAENKERYKNILQLCDSVEILSEKWTPYCMMVRNRYMVDNSDFVIAVWNGSVSGGTGKTVEYAFKHSKKTIIISC